MPKHPPRKWQSEASRAWNDAGHRGIAGVVTGGGKTVFALSCIDAIKPECSIIVVPSTALLDQWWEESASYFDLGLDEINIVAGKTGVRSGTINIVVLNTASKIAQRGRIPPSFLIVDECHKAASPEFRSALLFPKIASLGLTATPKRPYDDGLESVLIPSLGPVIYNYTYKEALEDKVIVPFELRNIIFEIEPDRQKEYDKVTIAIARSIDRHGADAPQTISLFIKRTRILNLSLNRVEIALRLVARNRGRRILIFHENIEACDLINELLKTNGVSSGAYHSSLTTRQRAEVLSRYRKGEIEVLVTCRALDEGFNVPETEIGIIAASTATRRQRIQRLGRILRPASEKEGAIVYTIVGSRPEIQRLRAEEAEMEGVAAVTWSKA